MKLSECIPGRTYRVKKIDLPEALSKRLEVLGMIENTPVSIYNRKGKGILIVYVRGTRLALGVNITENITVEDSGEGGKC